MRNSRHHPAFTAGIRCRSNPQISSHGVSSSESESGRLLGKSKKIPNVQIQIRTLHLVLAWPSRRWGDFKLRKMSPHSLFFPPTPPSPKFFLFMVSLSHGLLPTPQICHARLWMKRRRKGQTSDRAHSHQCQTLAVAVSLKISAFVHRRNESVPHELSDVLNIRVGVAIKLQGAGSRSVVTQQDRSKERQ